MKTILFMAMSVNGYIARSDGEEDFLSHRNWETFCDTAKDFGCFVIGRKTYEAVQAWGEEYSFDRLKEISKVIVTRDENYQASGEYIIASSPKDAVNKLKKKGIEKILVTGGAKINSAFMKEGLISEIIINVEPFVLGKGIKLFADEDFENKLKYIGSKEIGEGIIQLKYEVI